MIFLQILIVIVCLIVLLLLCPIWVLVCYDKTLVITWGFLFWRFRFYPDPSEDLLSDTLSVKQKRKRMQKLLRQEARKARRSEKGRKKGKKTAKRSLGESLGTRSAKGVVKELGGMFRLLRILILKFGNRLQVRIKRLEIVAASEDAASTAYLFAALSQGLSYGLALCDRYTNLKFKNKRVSVRADFCGEETRVNAVLLFRMRLGNLIGFLWSSLWEAAKDSMTETMKDAETSSDNIENKKGISL